MHVPPPDLIMATLCSQAFQIMKYKLQKVQNTPTHILTKTMKYDHISPVLRDLHRLLVKKRRDFLKILMFTFKSLNKFKICSTISVWVTWKYDSIDSLRSENHHNLKVQKTHLKSYRNRSFSHAVPVLWNDLPFAIKTWSSLDIFKSRLKCPSHISMTNVEIVESASIFAFSSRLNIYFAVTYNTDVGQVLYNHTINLVLLYGCIVWYTVRMNKIYCADNYDHWRSLPIHVTIYLWCIIRLYTIGCGNCTICV